MLRVFWLIVLFTAQWYNREAQSRLECDQVFLNYFLNILFKLYWKRRFENGFIWNTYSNWLTANICCRFVNGFRSHLNFTIKSDNLGPIAPLQGSGYLNVSHGKYVLCFMYFELQLLIYIYMHIHDSCLYRLKYSAKPLLGCFSSLIWFDIPLPRANFTIVNEEGQTCHYILQLGFGSSYTVLIPSTFSFGESVSHVFTVTDYSMNTIRNS